MVARFERERETFLKCGKMVKIVFSNGKKEELFEKSSGRETKRERDVFRVTGTRDTHVMRLLYE